MAPRENEKKLISKIVGLRQLIDVVDIGANPIEADGDPPYKKLSEAGLTSIVGFEPNINKPPKLLININK